jgi:hypothetical protein
MADLLCPVCGEANPIDGEVCQFCQALLHPVSFHNSTEQPQDSFRDHSQIQESKKTDFDSSGEEITQNQINNGGEELEQDSRNEIEPDWIQRIREKYTQEVEPNSNNLSEDTLNQNDQLDKIPVASDEDSLDETPDILEEATEEKSFTESIGPLTGLAGVINASPILSQIQESPVRSTQLHITDKQQTYADLLQKLVDNEGQPQTILQRRVIKQKPLVRTIIAVLLIFSALFPIVFTGVHIGTPTNSYNLSSTKQLIDGLQEGALVLTAFDYQPGLSGEMEAVFAPVLTHLLQRGVYLTLVSTEPTGPLQAERLLTIINPDRNHDDSTTEKYINLGYLPARTTGLVAFAQAPGQVLPLNLEGDYAWFDQPLRDIKSINDFEMVIVATENPEMAQAWIEQVKPELDETPLILVVSAQAEPVIRPYFESNPNQIQGLVGGLSAGVNYESLQGGVEVTGKLWDSFSLVLIMAMVIILGGSIIGSISANSNLDGKSGEEKL